MSTSLPAAAGRPLGHAIVIGAGMGGLIAANALAKHAAAVTILERDALPAGIANRKGTPHGQHVHALLARGLRAYEEAIPGFTDDLRAHGANAGDTGDGAIWFQAGARHRQTATGMTALVGTRALFEGVLRRHVAALPNVTIRDRTTVRGLRWNAGRTVVTGVYLEGREDDAAPGEAAADLVVDASGRGSLLLAWLAEAAVPPPPVVSVPIDIRYASRHFARRADDHQPEVAIVCVAGPESPRGGIALAVEGNRWHITLRSRADDMPPTDLEGFVAFCRSLPVPEIGRIAATAEPLDAGVRYHFPASTRRQYEQATGFPPGILPFADSICSFTPVYGQGMSIAAVEAGILDRCLATGTGNLFARFIREAVPFIDNAWKLACGGDLPLLMPAEQLPRPIRLTGGYLRRLHTAARTDAAVAAAFSQVVHLNAPITSLLTPRIAARVFTARVRRLHRVVAWRHTPVSAVVPPGE